MPGVCNVRVETCLPVDSLAIAGWQQRHATQLPADLRAFYLATDGLRIAWDYRTPPPAGGRMASLPVTTSGHCTSRYMKISARPPPPREKILGAPLQIYITIFSLLAKNLSR